MERCQPLLQGKAVQCRLQWATPVSVRVHAELAGLARHLCNDMVVDSQGRAYVGNFGFDLDAAGNGFWAARIGHPDKGFRAARLKRNFRKVANVKPMFNLLKLF